MPNIIHTLNTSMMSYQFRLSWRFIFSYIVFVSARLASSSPRYWSTARSMRPTGNSPRPLEYDCGLLASSSQSERRTAISEDMACTLAWSLKGGTYCTASVPWILMLREKTQPEIHTSRGRHPTLPRRVHHTAPIFAAPSRKALYFC